MPSSTPERPPSRSEVDLRALDDPVALTVALAEIDSVNPVLVSDAAGEDEVGRFVAAWGAAHGFEVHREEAAAGRANVVVVRRGSGGGRSLLLNGHLDTVGASSSSTMDVRIEQDHVEGARVVGRGVLDTKGGLACALVALLRAGRGDPARELTGDLLVAAVVDEEHGSLGTEALVGRWSADAAVVLEPTSMAVCTGHRGFAVVEVTLSGVPSHTSRPDRGANVAHAAADIVRSVLALDDEWAAGGAAIGDRPLTLVNRISTASETFTVPARAEMTVEVRTTASAGDGGGPEEQIAAVRAAIERAVDGLAGITVATVVSMARPPLGTSQDAPIVRALERTADGPVRLESAPFWTDAALHAASGVPAVVLGPMGAGLHEDLEWVSVDSLGRLTAWLTALAVDWCGPTAQ